MKKVLIMDKGAHFYCCDFQIHTPRDPQWKGNGATTEEERKAYAEDFVSACRNRGIQAVAITDHHDFAFFPYIQQAAENELAENGEPIKKADQLVVFPGMELTLGKPPCQALLILDADFPPEQLSTIIAKLSINQNESSDGKNKSPVEKIAHINDFKHLYAELDSLSYVKGRFIILPNVSDGGNHTLLRSGFENYYKTMPCVGGYVDGAITKLGTGNQNIIAGKSQAHQYKSIAVLQTSDMRNRDFDFLGDFCTWIKWSEPTAEAIRQACLAHESRLNIAAPQLPTAWIESISVSNSKFMGPIEIDFNPQYNALIGGRGTGKSTILEYIRWALCDQQNYDDAELSSVQNRRQSLIEKTLKDFDSDIKITFLINNVPHIIKRNASGGLQMKIGTDPFTACSTEDVESIIPIQAYSQKQLSSVGTRIEELQRFIYIPIQKRISTINNDISQLRDKIKFCYSNFQNQKRIQREISLLKKEKESKKMQATQLSSDVKDLSDAQRKTIELTPKYNKMSQTFLGWSDEYTQMRNTLENIVNRLISAKPTTEIDVDNSMENIFSELSLGYDGIYSQMATTIRQGISQMDERYDLLKSSHKKWDLQYNEFSTQYAEISTKVEANKSLLESLTQINNRINEIEISLAERETALKEYSGIATEYSSLVELWYSKHGEKNKLIAEQCGVLSDLSDGYIKANVSSCMDINPLRTSLKKAFEGARIGDAKITEMFTQVASAQDSMYEWAQLLNELERLAEHDNIDNNAQQIDTPNLSKAGFASNDKNRIATKLTSEIWLELATQELIYYPEFKYVVSKTMDETIAFKDASAGQQATALITVLLNQEGMPLIIDQPEDDIDNKSIEKIIASIWRAKQKRQIIFTSHNANLVVNGDAELILCCDYRKAGDQSGGHIKAQGAIDEKIIKTEITDVMEGGEKAFRLRQEKYGF